MGGWSIAAVGELENVEFMIPAQFEKGIRTDIHVASTGQREYAVENVLQRRRGERSMGPPRFPGNCSDCVFGDNNVQGFGTTLGMATCKHTNLSSLLYQSNFSALLNLDIECTSPYFILANASF